MKEKFKSLIFSICIGTFCFGSPVDASLKRSPPTSNHVLLLNCPLNAGFGAIVCTVLGALNRYEEGGYTGIKVDLNSGIYLDLARGPNWWEYFFEPIDFGKGEAPYYVFNPDECLELCAEGYELEREKAYGLIQRYVRLVPNIQVKVDSFVRRHFRGHYVVGVHHRGTDKKVEIPIVPYEDTFYAVKRLFTGVSQVHADVRIFVATDEQQFIDYLSGWFPDKVFFGDFVRSQDGEPLHYSNHLYKSSYQKGREALMDCLLLSHCDSLIVPSFSAFSMLAQKFNPQMAVFPVKAPE